MFPTTLDVLPNDVLYEVLCHSSVRDILSLRQVSRKFDHLTHHRPIWVNAYRRCPILLPPGPFSYQSAVDLERMLKRGHLLEANWTSPSPRPVSRQTFAIAPVHSRHNRMKFVGKYLLMAGRPMFRCYDLESKNEELAPIAAYDSVETIFDCVVEKYSVMDSSNCQLLCALKSQPAEVTLLTLHISQCSPKFELMKEVRLPRPIYHHIRIIGDILATDSTYNGPMLFHIPTGQVYDLPPCDFSDNVMTYHGVRSTFVVTSNHLICHSFLGSDGILEVFPLPRGAAQLNEDDETHILTRSHKCVHHYDLGWNFCGPLTERHDLQDNDHSVHYTFVTMTHRTYQLGFLDISLVSDSVTTTLTNTAESEFEGEGGVTAFMFEGSSRAGVYRLVVLTPRREVFALTIFEDGDGKRVIRCEPIVVDDGLTKLRLEMGQRWTAFDGVQGRMCHLVSSGHIEVINFV